MRKKIKALVASATLATALAGPVVVDSNPVEAANCTSSGNSLYASGTCWGYICYRIVARTANGGRLYGPVRCNGITSSVFAYGSPITSWFVQL